MQENSSKRLRQVLRLLMYGLILKVTLGVVSTFRDYMPPNFQSDFLRGRDAYFWNGYHWAFFAHVTSGPCSLIFGMILLSERIRQRTPKWHRRVGRVQVAIVLLLVVPSGLGMAFYSATGATAGVGFGALSVATGLSVWLGWRSALKRRFVEHRRWMSRCFLLLCSAVVLRLTAGLFTVTGVEGEWTYPFAAWTSWLVPLAVLESTRLRKPKPRLSHPTATTEVTLTDKPPTSGD